MNRAIVEIISDFSWTARDIVYIDDDRYFVVCRVNVLSGGGKEEHLVVRSMASPPDKEACEIINRKLRQTENEATISFCIADHEGWAQVVAGLDREFNMFNLAAAIAVIKACCGWDESPSMMIRINDVDARVWPRFDGRQWVATDSTDLL